MIFEFLFWSVCHVYTSGMFCIHDFYEFASSFQLVPNQRSRCHWSGGGLIMIYALFILQLCLSIPLIINEPWAMFLLYSDNSKLISVCLLKYNIFLLKIKYALVTFCCLPSTYSASWCIQPVLSCQLAYCGMGDKGIWWERERKWGRGNKRTQRIERETREKKRL